MIQKHKTKKKKLIKRPKEDLNQNGTEKNLHGFPSAHESFL